MIAVVARMTVKEGQQAEFERVMTALAATVRAEEPGCKLYQLCRSSDARRFVMLERYVSQEALAQHAKTAHFREASAKLGALLDGRPEIDVLTEIDS